jgi:hypothetical protein
LHLYLSRIYISFGKSDDAPSSLSSSLFVGLAWNQGNCHLHWLLFGSSTSAICHSFQSGGASSGSVYHATPMFPRPSACSALELFQ